MYSRRDPLLNTTEFLFSKPDSIITKELRSKSFKDWQAQELLAELKAESREHEHRANAIKRVLDPFSEWSDREIAARPDADVSFGRFIANTKEERARERARRDEQARLSKKEEQARRAERAVLKKKRRAL